MAHAMIEKIALKFEDALGDPIQGFLSPVNAFDELRGGLDLLSQVIPVLARQFAALGHQASIQGTDAQPGQSLVAQKNHVLVSDLLYGDIRDDRTQFLGVKAARRLGFKRGNQMRGIGDLFYRNVKFAHQLVVALGFQQLEMVANDARREARAQVEILELYQEAFAQVARRDPDWIEELNLLQHGFNFLQRDRFPGT